MHYKAPDNSLHFIEPEYAHLLPVGCVQITDAEAEQIRIANLPMVDPKDAIRAEITTLEASITPRRLRDAVLTGDTSFVKQVDAEIAALRAKL